jgi:pyruvate kinase
MSKFNRTKIVATIGPATQDEKTLKKIIQAGVDVCRFNFSHADYDVLKEVYKLIKKINIEVQQHTAVLADLQGPKIRTGEMQDGEIRIKNGSIIKVQAAPVVGTPEVISINYKKLPQEVSVGDRILLDDGKLVLQVTEAGSKSFFKAKVIQGGLLKPRKGVNLPNTEISLPCLSTKDKKDLEFALALGVEWVALSFVRSADDIKELRKLIKKHKAEAKIIAKIEKPEAIEDIDNIIAEADGLMVARGDLGIEVPYQDVPILQKMMIKKCLKHSKPIIVATQMMESMMENIHPSRAEVNDVANSVLDGADAVMLSGETSVGKHPVKVIETMSNICDKVERFGDIYNPNITPSFTESRMISDNICETAANMAKRSDVKAILTMSNSGYSAMKIASFRPKSNIYVFTDNHRVLNTVNLVWGVRGFYYDKYASTDETIQDIKQILKDQRLVKNGDIVINIASMPIELRGMTNTIKMSHIQGKK